MNKDDLDLHHLTKSAQIVARMSSEERIQHIRTDRFLGYPLALDAFSRLETLLSWPRNQRMRNMLPIGATNNGKSMIVERFRRQHPIIQKSDKVEIPLLCMQMPSAPSVQRFYIALLASAGAPMSKGQKTTTLESVALKVMRGAGVRLLIIDELHNALAGTITQQREFLNLLRYLSNELRVSLVGVGTRDAYLAVRSDDQLENRFEPFMLPLWKAGDATSSLIASFAASFPLRRRSKISSPDVVQYLLGRCEGTIGELTHLLTLAAVLAVESGEEAINKEILRSTEYYGPSDRRRIVERELN